MQEVNLSFYLKRKEEKADGTAPILGRIRIGKSMVQFSAKVNVPVSLWDTKSGRAIGKSKTAQTINTSLNKISVAIHSAHKELLVKKENVSALEVKNAFQGIASEQDTLVKYFEAHNEKFLNNVGVNRAEGTYKRFLTSLGHLKRFMRKKYNIADIPFQALTPSFVADYDYHLRVELGLACGTVTNTIVHLRRIVKIALNNGLLRNDPFMDYEYITQPIVPKSLTADELKTLMTAKLSRPNLNFIRDMFLFSSFTGIAFSDMRNLTEKNIYTAEDGVRWVHLKRKKTGTPCHIPLLEIPLQLIEKYKRFAAYIPEQPPRKRRHMIQEELDKFMNVSIASKRVCHTRDMFVFATFTGLSYADMCNLSEEHIHEENGSSWIKIKRQKTKSQCHIPILDVPLQIIEKYKSERKGNRIFNMINLSCMNVNLKKIAKLCGVEKCITYHYSRHSILSFDLRINKLQNIFC